MQILYYTKTEPFRHTVELNAASEKLIKQRCDLEINFVFLPGLLGKQ